MPEQETKWVEAPAGAVDLPGNYRSMLAFIDKMEHLGQFQDRLDITGDLDCIWKALFEEIRLFADAEVCALFLVEDVTLDFDLKAVTPQSQAHFCRREIDLQIECGTFSWIINRRQPSIIPSLAFKRQRTVIMLPLATVRKTLGAVMLLTRIADSAITQETLKLLGMLARQCALVMENALLYDSLRKEHESLKRAQARMLQAEKLATVGRLTAGACHEILNPLNIISGYVQLLQMGGGNTGQRSERYLTVMKQQTDRISDIVKDLMRFSRQPAEHIAPVQINDLIEKAIQAVETELRCENIRPQLALANELPPVNGDAEGLSRVFSNLIANAREAMAPSGGCLRIRTETATDSRLPTDGGPVVRICFHDDGSGLPESVRNLIFDPFYTTKETGEGTGLGLSIGYGIIKAHAGEIQVDSRPNTGTLFTIDLPAAEG